jgi:predicted nucleic acid-binding protein
VKLASDASALVAEALRDRGRRLISHSDLNLYAAPPTWSETVHEIGRRLDAMVLRGRILPLQRDLAFAEAMALLSAKVIVVPEEEYGEFEAEARDRVPRDPNDWPTVALALSLGCGVWTNDQDFFGCGVPVWTTETLLTHVAAGRAALEN